MGLPKFRGRGMGVSNGFLRSPGLSQMMKHSPGPQGIRQRFPCPPPPPMRPPMFQPPPFHTGVPPPRHPPIPHSPRPPHISPPLRPPHLPPPPLRPPHLPQPSLRPQHLPPPPVRPPHLPPPPYMPPFPPLPPELRGRQGPVGFGPGPAAPLRGKRGAASLRDGRGKAKVKKANMDAGNNWAGVHYCETCDKDLKDAEKLTLHLAEHTVCGRDGCTFQAHPKIIEKHVRVQHWTGLYKKICVADNPEEIAKWIQERKSRYPTKANIERRKAERKEQVDRGERLGHEPQSFNSFPRGRNARRGIQNRMRGNHKQFWSRTGDEVKVEGSKEQTAEQEKFGEHRSSFRGTGLQRRMRGNHWKFRPRTDETPDMKTEICEAQGEEQEKRGRGRWNRFRGRGTRGRMRGFYRRYRSGENDNDEDEIDDENSAEMERWNAQVAEEEKLMGRGHLVAFPGTGAFPDSCEDINPALGNQEEGEFSDTEWEGSLAASSRRKQPVASKVLMSLIGSYASDLSDDEGNSECTASEVLPVIASNAGNICNSTIIEGQQPEEAVTQNDSDGAPEEAPIVFGKLTEELPEVPSSTSGNTDEAIHHSRRRKHKARSEKWQGGVNTTEASSDKRTPRPVATRPWYPRQRRPTLLDKLLREEIRHERNVILQCINHVVKCNFFSGHSVSEAIDCGTGSPPNSRLKVVAECVSHIVNCGLLDELDSANTDDKLAQCM